MIRRLAAVLLISILLISACGGRPVDLPDGDGAPGGQILQIALPRLVIDVDAQGNPSILGISPALLGTLGVDVSGFQLPAATVAQFTAAGIQHLEIVSAGDRLLLYVDGKPLPYLTWSPDSLNRALDFAATLNVDNAATIRRIVPLITRLGLDVVLRFPRDATTAEIPMTDASKVRDFPASVTTEPVSVIIKFEISYDAQGRPGIMGLSADDVEALGLGVSRMASETLGQLQSGNVQHLEIRTKPDGAYFYVNNEVLPTLTWDTTTLANLVDFISKLTANAGFTPLVQAVAPYLDRADLGILIHFPAAAGQTPIEAQMH